MTVLSRCSLVLLAGAAAAAGAAQNTAPYPNKPIRAIVGFVPGGATDILARQLGQKMADSMGQQIIIDNRAGGGGLIASVMAKESPPDGYTIFFGTISTLATNVATKRSLPYDPVRDYAPITLTASTPYFLVVHPGVAAGSVKEFIALARAKPGQLNFGSSGTGGGAHLAMEMFRSMAKIDMVHIAYKGSAQAATEVLAGQIQMSFTQPAVMLPHAKAGRLKVLGVTSAKRLHSWPEAPPIGETVPGYESTSWQGILAPAKTPKPVVDRLYAEVVKALKSKDIEGRLIAEGSEVGGIPPDEFGRYIKSEIAKWSKVVADAKIAIE